MAVSHDVLSSKKSGHFQAFQTGAHAPAAVPPPLPKPIAASLALLDGNVRTGKLARFTPQTTDLVVELDRYGKTILPAEQIAYIGFQTITDAPTKPAEAELETLRIHVSGGASFLVDVQRSALGSVIGFFAWPAEITPYAAVFFYAHAVNAKEKNVPLGDMLVDSGVLGANGLKRGLDQQQVHRSIPVGQILVEQGQVDAKAMEEAAALQSRKKLRIGQILVEAGLATNEAIERALAEQKQRRGKRIGEVLVDMGIVRESDLAETLGRKFEIPFVNLERFDIEKAAGALVPTDIIAKYGILPVKVTSVGLVVAIADPLAIDAIDAVRKHVKRRIDEVIVVPSQLQRFVDEHLKQRSAEVATAAGVAFDDLLRKLPGEDNGGVEVEEDDSDNREVNVQTRDADGTLVKLVNQIIVDAHRRGASDIHIEPNGRERNVVVRFRVDGDCFTYQEIPGVYRHQIVARIKIMAQLDIAERRKPQDGKIRFRLQDRLIELRVATMPTVNGNEDVVLRLLASSKPHPLDQMGLAERNLVELRRLIHQPYGLVLCVGPTGSGKTTTLHSALGEINTADQKIWTAEDPVEITQPGLRQVQMNAKIGLNFATALRSFLRADPDVIMVGEMRDHETASIAIEASLTGHLVMSTLHTNSAAETITRLLDMGLDPFSFSDSLLGILAQRLARALCMRCSVRALATDEEKHEMVRPFGSEEALRAAVPSLGDAPIMIYRAVGCESCGNTGYKGRVALHELLVVDDGTRQAIAQKAPVGEIRRIAKEGGMSTLLVDGIGKALAGRTDMKQVLAVCSK